MINTYNESALHETLKKLYALESNGIMEVQLDDTPWICDILDENKNVIEIHGNGVTFSCPTCHSKYNSDDIISSSSVPVCTKCNDVLKPDIILYEEMLDEYKLMESRELVNNATTMLVMGSSLVVNPAASLVHDFLINMKLDRTNSKKLFIINKGSTAYDGFKEIIRYNGNIIDFVDEFQRRRKK